MNEEKLWRDIRSLSPEAKRAVADFVALLRDRQKPSRSTVRAAKRQLADEPFIGIWRDRQDMEDSGKWVRSLRDREWSPS